ncbi:M12 family metallo-peptidase [Marinobacter sp. CHS3-4]|uniref:M12 family metallo-peptidase n=1 Tax=Marinobacter sp. CHS3-4 TaxID=3045174 RepID=UPI0024B5D972|nr:M12 family metallo-peptidase [Marinobacter sp. CHS3-4]MDI9244490.1 M12 family metallo-peptidase [Marinobacter sp. CHS3-4]
MPTKSIQFVAAMLFGLLFTGTSVFAAERTTLSKDLWIEGHAYEAKLVNSSMIGMDLPDSGEHFKGHFPEDPDSWVRVSRIDDRWEGLAFVFGEMHAIGGGGATRAASYSFSGIDAPKCGLEHDHSDHKMTITPESLVSPAMAQAVSSSYDTLCAERVDGTCLLLELELAFDQQFQDRFPDTYRSRAASIMNMVEGFYYEQFGIAFDTLSLNFLGSVVFSTSSDSSDVLNDVASKRGNGELAFLESEQSLFHFITGRSFSGGVAGLAYVGTVCHSNFNYAEGAGVGTGVSSGARSPSSTAVVIAHELGHNLGASHDGSNNSCPTGENIMSPSVSSSFDSFSSCSEDYITSEISSRSAVEQCFNFPADAGIEALVSNNSEVAEGDLYTGYFDVVYQEASESADRLAVEGSIGAGEGVLQQVTLNGADCTLNSQTSFSCPETQVQASSQLVVQVTAGSSPTVNLAKGVAVVSESGEVKDILADNDTLLTRITVVENTDVAPEEPEVPESQPRDTGGDSESTESSGGGSSSGGGGSLGWLALLAGLAGVTRRCKRAV